MALGNKQNDSTELVIIRDVTPKDKSKSYFEVIQKQGDPAAWVVTQTTDRFNGNFKSLKRGLKYDVSKPKQKELAEKYGNKPSIELTLVDEAANQTYLYKFNLRLATRNLINRFLSLTAGDNIEISIWNDKVHGYENLSLRQNGELIKWKFDKDQIPAPEELRKKDGTLVSRSFDEVDQFFLDQIDSFYLHANAAPPVPTGVTSALEKAKVKAEVAEDEIPF